MNIRTHRDVFTKDTHPPPPNNDPPRQRTLRRVANKHHAVMFVPQIMFQMMTHPSAGPHARPC
ncbi:MAG: hypothetical protein WBM71_01535, partial [Sedimenticolaceae bacterium]